ncbi:oxygen-independent coproporphyrinogen III oxidase [Solimonas terrae]|uniref:Coproporphyrinogen-III oxidase n=1 Tax=Solimonas terrae TaxID=1396819 RepID=A0A6M2BM28_9GAMM|nr:oxygen-independent coproporphyrinogen III oxidase [Solimonas terrae]NGY03187.1 oxygen-independent coproporphyrinogen III oxidase [Solimonas terrae]
MPTVIDSDADLIRRYGGSVPRYTSYPTALQFTESFGPEQLREALARRRADAPPSLYLHVPFCRSPCFYCACTRVISRRPEIGERYVQRLLAEIASWAALWRGAQRGVRQLHFGGGTPTALDDRQLAELMTALDQHFGLIDDADREYSIEIDPRTVDAERLRVLAGIGFNRVSFGVQDLDPRVQEAINREQAPTLTVAAVDGARRAGFRSVAVDLIYGLPRQTVTSFATTVRRIAELRPDRVAVYAYAHMPAQFAAQRQIVAGELPDAATRLQLLQIAVEAFVAAGYERIGMDHFALAGDDLARAQAAGTLQRNFQGYSTHAGSDLIGIGMSAISRIGDCYVQNAKTLQSYAARIDAGSLPVQRGLHLDADDLLRRAVIETVMCGTQVDCARIGREHGIDFWPYFADCKPALQALAEDGLIELAGDRIRITSRGRPLVRNIARVFDRYAVDAATPRHSAAI